MTALFHSSPRLHPPYAEDQPYARSILTFHVLRSGAVSGSLIAAATSTFSTLYWGPRTFTTFIPRLLIHSSRGVIYGTILSGLGLAGRMWDKQEIEWKDRSWRLIENKYQVEVDNFLLAGAPLGAIIALRAARGRLWPVQLRDSVWRLATGGAGVGMSVATVGYMVWRHGIKGGKFPER
jgi:hypothetical protein